MNGKAGEDQTNGLGIAGFVVSLVGLCGSAGILSPIGLIISLVALGKQPRGFAVAGTVLGAVGSCGLILAIVFIPVVVLAMAALGLTAAAIGVASIAGPELEAKVEMFVISTNIEERIHGSGGTLPATLDEVVSSLKKEQVTDPWGQKYFYEVTQNGSAYRLFSAGPDKTPGTADDVRYEWKVDFNRRPSHVDPSPSLGAPPPPSEAPSSETPDPATGG